MITLIFNKVTNYNKTLYCGFTDQSTPSTEYFIPMNHMTDIDTAQNYVSENNKNDGRFYLSEDQFKVARTALTQEI